MQSFGAMPGCRFRERLPCESESPLEGGGGGAAERIRVPELKGLLPTPAGACGAGIDGGTLNEVGAERWRGVPGVALMCA